MPRKVASAEVSHAIELMYQGVGQREIERETGLSRPYLRKISRKIGFQFPRNGIEVLGRLCMCVNCGTFFRKPPSKVERAKKQFCDAMCREAFFRGVNHPMWNEGKTANSFSSWVKNQSSYDEFKKIVLERDGNKCMISGRIDNLQVHHIFPKAEGFSPEKALDPQNGMVLNFDIHQELHSLIREGNGFQESIAMLKEKYQENKNEVIV